MPKRSEFVCLAYVHDGHDVTHSFAQSLQDLVLYDLTHEGHLEGGRIANRCGTSAVASARNQVVREFLKADRADWLLWVDTDMGFLPDSLARLMQVADPTERPIIGGLCFGQKETDLDGYGGYRTSARATIFDWVQNPDENVPAYFTARAWYPPDRLVRCAGTGSAFILIHRSVFEKLQYEYEENWYSQIRGDDGQLIGEDISFCIRANVCHFPVHVHTGIRTTHMKTLWLGEPDFWAQHNPPPATERVAVLVPVMKRPHNAEPFMRALRASTGLADVYAIYDADDTATRDAWATAGATVIESTGPRFGTKINDGYRATTEPWVFLVGDDARCKPGWLDHAQYASTATGAAVIGTNDLANPRVMRGEHATHILIARDYIDEHGASWDGPKTVCHEGYRHWYVDDEIVTVAKSRGTFMAALGSRVEHLHPIWGTAENDDVYKLGQHYADTDRRLFGRRLKQHEAV